MAVAQTKPWYEAKSQVWHKAVVNLGNTNRNYHTQYTDTVIQLTKYHCLGHSGSLNIRAPASGLGHRGSLDECAPASRLTLRLLTCCSSHFTYNNFSRNPTIYSRKYRMHTCIFAEAYICLYIYTVSQKKTGPLLSFEITPNKLCLIIIIISWENRQRVLNIVAVSYTHLTLPTKRIV